MGNSLLYTGAQFQELNQSELIAIDGGKSLAYDLGHMAGSIGFAIICVAVLKCCPL